MDMKKMVNERAKIGLYRNHKSHALVVRLPCDDEKEARRVVAEYGGTALCNAWKGRESWWVKWSAQAAARLLKGVQTSLTGSQAARAAIGIQFQVVVYSQRRGHGVGAVIGEEERAERERLVAKMEAL